MREVLFRGKRIDNGEWIYGSLEVNPETGKYSIFAYSASKRCWFYMPVIPETVGQYTGLTDYIGNKIFDGDICQDWLRKIFVVKWDKENARFLGYCKDNKIMYVGKEPKVDIIGNIHDNPELIGGVTDG